jgi:hypothetical protein
MRSVLRALAAVAALLVAALAALAVLLPRLVDRPEVRARIEAAARDATGRELSYEALRAGIFPPAIEVVKPALAGETAGAPPLFEADRVALRLALMPLLDRAIVIDRLKIEGARARVVRAPPPVTPAAAESVAAPATPAPRGEPVASKPGALFGVRTIDVENGRLSLEDRSVSPPVLLELDDIDAKVRATSSDAPFRFEATLRLESGGAIALQGTATAGGEVDAEATLERVEAKPFTAYLGHGRSIAGLLGGSIHASGPATAPAKVDAKLRLEDAVVALDAVRLSGKLGLSASLASSQGLLGGPFEIDATEADLAYAGAFHKPPGTAATTSGTLQERAGGGFDVEELRVKIKNFEAHGSVHSLPRQELVLAAEPFELAGWEALFPARAGKALAGRLALDVRVSPLSLAPVGALSATGRDIEAGAFSAAVTGPLRFDARFEAPLASAKPLTDVVSGSLDFVLGPGTLQGVSILRDTIERSGPVVQAAVAAGQSFGGRDVRRMYGDRFERIGGLVKVGEGLARFDPIEAVYRDYRLELRGSVRLADRALDAKGQIVFADAKGAGALRGQTLPISHIGGSVDRPRVELSQEDVARLVASATGSTLERRLDPLLDRLRKDAGDAKSPLSALQNLLRGRKQD